MTWAQTDRTDLFILTGFLGSGKTTLLNALLREPALADTAVIVNEFGDIGLDHLLVEAASGDVILLDSGCLCCAMGETFAETLVSLWVRRERGEIQPFSRVVVETSGLAEPLPLVATVMKNPMVAPHFRMAGVVTVVDTVFGPVTFAQHREAREQLALADTIILTKADLPDARIDETRAIVAARNPAGRTIEAIRGAVDAGRVLDGTGWSARDTEPPADHHHHRSQRLQRSLVLPRPVTWAALAAFNASVKASAEPLLRCKGLLAVRGEPGPVLVQGVRSLIELVRLDRWPDDDRTSRLICLFDAPPVDFDGLVAALAVPA